MLVWCSPPASLAAAGGYDGMFSTSMIIPQRSPSAYPGIARLARATMLGTLDEDYVRTARAKGLAEHVVVGATSRNAVVAVTTVIGLSMVGCSKARSSPNAAPCRY
jgi:ABC-type microcin C transport system permease subunit YejB